MIVGGAKKSDYVFHLRQNKRKQSMCVVWFAHRTDHDEICTILDDTTLGERIPDPVALLIEVGYMPNPRTSDDWEFPIETEASMVMTTESMVYHHLEEL